MQELIANTGDPQAARVKMRVFQLYLQDVPFGLNNPNRS
jgi:hypothetical protein